MGKVVMVIGILLVSGNVYAAGVICGRAVPVFQGDDISYFRAGGDASLAVCNSPYSKVVLGDAEVVESQNTLFTTVVKRYLKLESGLMVEMSTGEKSQVDTAIANADPLKVYKDDIAGNNFCDSTSLTALINRIDAVSTALDGDINAISNVATAKTAITSVKNAMIAGFKKVVTCIVDRRFVK